MLIWPHGRTGRRASRTARGRASGRHLHVPRAAREAWQALAPRPRRPPARPRLAVPGDRPHGGLRDVRGAQSGGRHVCRAERRHHHRHRPGLGSRLHDRRQRRHGEGRHLLPAHRQEAPARPDDRQAEQPALHLPRRLRRSLPADAGRGVPRPAPLRPHLLQPGADVGGRHRTGRRRHGVVHCRGRLRARDERRDGHRQGPGHDLPRRPAAGEGGHGRRGQRRGPRRR